MKRNTKFIKGLKRELLRLPQDQQDALNLIENKVVSILWGKAGTGKTHVAVFSALQSLASGDIEKILITRPTVSDEDIGFLPGSLEEKMEPWVTPIYENMKNIIGVENSKDLMEQEIVRIKPISFMRGQTFQKATVIVDEAQNVTHKQMEMILGRLGQKSKMIICGDIRQKDLSSKKLSGFPFLLKKATQIAEVGDIELFTNHRHPVVNKLLELYKSN